MTSARPTAISDSELPEVIDLTPEEAEELLDREAREFLGMSGEEFRRKWKSGDFADGYEDRDVQRVSFLLGPDYEE